MFFAKLNFFPVLFEEIHVSLVFLNENKCIYRGKSCLLEKDRLALGCDDMKYYFISIS